MKRRNSKLKTIISLGSLLIFLSSQGSFVYAQSVVPPTPTIDRLAEPTLPANPDLADLGAQDYWLYCSPCHGDQAQGLTEDFRRQYPPEHQNCWESGCHGKLPYINGWTIPFYVPALVGPNALKRFPDARELKRYMVEKMPFQTPGILDDEIYWRITGFVLKQNGYWDGKGNLNELTARKIILNPILVSTPTPIVTSSPSPTPTITKAQLVDEIPSSNDPSTVRVTALALAVILLVGGISGARWLRKIM